MTRIVDAINTAATIVFQFQCLTGLRFGYWNELDCWALADESLAEG
jgi:hypothetical protein